MFTLLVERIRGIDDMQQQVGFPGFLQGRMKGRNQFVWQITDKTHGINQQYIAGRNIG